MAAASISTEQMLQETDRIHTLALFSFALLIGSAVDTSLENLIFALELVLKLVFEFEVVGLAVLRSLTRLECADLFLLGLVCCTFTHYVWWVCGAN
jgi:hypothetical protein